jgi:hypothetical protein
MNNDYLNTGTIKTGNDNWDMGNGEDVPQNVPGQVPMVPPVAAVKQAAKVEAPKPESAGTPGKSAYRFTRTPQPAGTHGGASGPSDDSGREIITGIDFPWDWCQNLSSNLSNDLKQCYADLRRIDNLPTHTETPQGIKQNPKLITEQRRVRKLLGEHIMKLSSGMQAIHIDANDISKIQKAQNKQPLIMAERQAVLEKFLERPIPEPALPDEHASIPASSKQELAMNPKARVLADDLIKHHLMFARHLACGAELFAIVNFDLIHPGEHIAHLERELRVCSDLEHARRLQAKIALAKQNGEKEIDHRVNRTVADAKNQAAQRWEPVFDTFNTIFARCQTLLIEWRGEAMQAESEFFAGFSMEWRQTDLSKRFADFQAEVNKLTGSKTSFAWFGIQDYAAD